MVYSIDYKVGTYFTYQSLIPLTAFMLYSIWAWHVICAPDAFSWNFCFVFLNLGQVVYLVYQMRPVKFDPELEEVYHTLFEPFKVSRPDPPIDYVGNQNNLFSFTFSYNESFG